jgi:hypothetical protein
VDDEGNDSASSDEASDEDDVEAGGSDGEGGCGIDTDDLVTAGIATDPDDDDDDDDDNDAAAEVGRGDTDGDGDGDASGAFRLSACSTKGGTAEGTDILCTRTFMMRCEASANSADDKTPSRSMSDSVLMSIYKTEITMTGA